MAYSFDNARSLIAVAIILLVCWLLSEDRKRFPFVLTAIALGLQVGLALLFFGAQNAQEALTGLTAATDTLASASDVGVQFVFGYLGGGESPYVLSGEASPFIFAFRVLPVIVVLAALSALLWHWRILAWITRLFGFLFARMLRMSGALALATAANVFTGAIEAPLIVRPYLERMSRSELFVLIVVGLATTGSGAMVAYAIMLGPVLPNAAAHVLLASIISVPAGVLLARIMIPENEGWQASDGDSALEFSTTMDAVTHGVRDGVIVVVQLAASIVVFVAFVAIANNFLGLMPSLGGQPVTLQRLAGFVFTPVAFLVGIPWNEAHSAGNVLGTKFFLSEFVALAEMGAAPAGEMTERTRMILIYAVCSFASIVSIGVISGGLAALAPSRYAEILSLAWKALLPGFMATLMTAAIIAALPAQLFNG